VTRTALILAAAGSLLCTLGAPAQDFGPVVPPQDRNAALKYAYAYISFPEDLNKLVADVDMSKVGFDKNPERQPKEYRDALEALSKGQETINLLIKASKLKKNDNEIEYESGIWALLPHLAKARSASRLLRLDARARLIQGDPNASAERLATIVRMADHLKTDRTLISSLVAAAMTSLAAQETTAQLDSGLLTPPARATILAAFRALDPVDPFSMKGAVRGERVIFLDWVKRTYTGPDAGKRLVADGVLSVIGEDANSDGTKAIAAMSGAELAAEVDRLSPYYDRILAAWDQPDVADRLAALESAISAGEFGTLAKYFAPAMSKARQSSARIQDEVRGITKRLAAE